MSNGLPVAGQRLRLEITERTVVHDLRATVDRMRALMAHGIEFSLDDFGSGNSSLTFLQKLPVREVKIDQSYVRRILHHPNDAAIVRAVLAMCNALDLRVVAEGVETPEQADFLRRHRCDEIQGFYYSPPMPQEAVAGYAADFDAGKAGGAAAT